jgi:colanic acid biosynthesis glycosyl transferase WcaI
MRLLVLSLNYSPEPTGCAPHATALAEYFAARGQNVTVLTAFPFAPAWKRWPAHRGVFTRKIVQNGVTLIRVSHFIPRRPGSAWQRLTLELSFCVSAASVLLLRLRRRRERPDAVLYVGAQPAIAMLARGIAKIFSAAYFINVNDLAAQAAADVGIVRTGWVRRALERFEFAAYLPATGASVLCRSFADALVAHGYPSDRIRLIRSPVDLDRIRPMPCRLEYRQRLGIPADAFVVLFAGSMGLKQGLTNVVDAALQRHTRHVGSQRIAWVLVGDGETRAELGRLVTEHDLGDSVQLLPFQPEGNLAEMFAAADVLLLNQRASVKDTVIPSKLLTYMAAGRPVLAAVNRASQGAHILREADGGLLVSPDDPVALVQGVQALMHAGASTLADMGRRNRLYAERHFDQQKILAEHESFIGDRLAQSRGLHAPVSA